MEFGFFVYQLVQNALPEKYLWALIIAIGFDILTGVLKAIKDHKFNSSFGLTGLVRKTSILASSVFVGILEYLLWNEMMIAKVFCLIAILYEVTSIFENINEIDGRFGKAIESVFKTITGRLKHDAHQENDDARGNRS